MGGGLALRIVHGDVPDRLRNVELWTLDMGALVAGTDRARDEITFQLQPDNGDASGGYPISVTSTDAVFLPGSRVSLRARNGDTVIETGIGDLEGTLSPTIDLKDNVISLTKFAFILPGVITPDLYSI